MKRETVYFTIWQSPLCDIYLYADDHHLIGLTYRPNDEAVVKKLGLRDLSDKPSPIIEQAIRELTEYFAGRRTVFEVPLSMSGTDFQERAWAHLRQIPFGEVLSYKEQAESIGSPTAVRAVGSANGRNPISIIVPCHRVLGSDGKISGYAGGPDVKAKLLALEGYEEKSRQLRSKTPYMETASFSSASL